MQVWISGIAGHMGRAVLEACKAQGIEVIGGVDVAPLEGSAIPVYASFDEAPVMGDAIIDFSKPGSLDALLRYATGHGIPAVIATTGFDEAQEAAIREAAGQTALFRSANMSIGVALLRRLAYQAAKVLGDSFDVEIVEAHHNRKADAPSGTALALYDAVKEAYDQPPKLVGGRFGRDCKREKGEIGMHALRGGTVTGEHEVCFFGPMERIRLCHSAEDRAVFAQGAVRAAQFLVGKAPELYGMDELLAEV